MSATKRIQQGVRALLAYTQTIDYDLAAEYLTTEQLTLFQQLGRGEQLHSLNVLRAVLAQENNTPLDLALAALMHDIGKIRYHLAVWQKTEVVLLRRLTPRFYYRMSEGQQLTFWRAPFIVAEQHPCWSAAILEQTGAPARAVWLAAHHADPLEKWHDHVHFALLKRLRLADDAN